MLFFLDDLYSRWARPALPCITREREKRPADPVKAHQRKMQKKARAITRQARRKAR